MPPNGGIGLPYDMAVPPIGGTIGLPLLLPKKPIVLIPNLVVFREGRRQDYVWGMIPLSEAV